MTFPQHWGNPQGLKNVTSPTLGKFLSAGSPQTVINTPPKISHIIFVLSILKFDLLFTLLICF